MPINRRQLIQGASALITTGIAAGYTRPAFAADNIVATTYPGSFDEAFQAVVAPALTKNSGHSVNFSPLLNVDQIGRIQAARNAPPFDVVLFDEGPLIAAIEADILDKFPTEQSIYYDDIPEAFRHPDGYAPVITAQLVGIAYNPARIETPPTSWEALWDPQYAGRVGIVGPGSSLGTAFLIEIAKMRGGSETDVAPGFEALRELIPNIGAVASSPGALASLFQQGEIDIAFNYWNNVALLAARGVNIAYATPDTGSVVIRTSAQIVKNNQSPDAVLAYLDTVMSPDVQAALETDPWVMMPTNSKVPLTGANLTVAESVESMVANNVLLDWSQFQHLRGGWIEQFEREMQS